MRTMGIQSGCSASGSVTIRTGVRRKTFTQLVELSFSLLGLKMHLTP
jgi:hypothetical protein